MTAAAGDLQSYHQCNRSESLTSPPQDQDSLGGRGSQALKPAVGYACRGGAHKSRSAKSWGGAPEIAPYYWLPQEGGTLSYHSLRCHALQLAAPHGSLRRFCVVIRRRVEDTGKMAAVAGLVRGPLRQVGSGPWRARRRLCDLSEPFSLSLPGFRAAEEAISPLGARRSAGNRSRRRARPGGSPGSREQA